MSTWSINWSEVNTQLETIPAQAFTFSLLGANLSERDPHKVEVSAAIASEGPFQGRKLYFSYPDPTKYPWSRTMAKRLMESIGVEAQDGESLVDYLNRNKGQRFASMVQHRSYTPEGGSEIVKAELSIFNVRPAA